MFGKLIKHEFRAVSRIMLPISLIVLLTTVSANLSLRGLGSSSNTFVNILFGLFIAAFVISMIAAAVMTVVVMVMRFYKNILRDEGYLMMTLPVSVHGLVWSKIVVSIVWMLIVILLIYLAVFATVFNALSMETDIGEIINAMPSLNELLQEFYEQTGMTGKELPTIILEGLVLALLGAVASCLQFYAAMSLGHRAANHKILLSVVAYIGLDFAFKIVFGLMLSGYGNAFSSMDSVTLFHAVNFVMSAPLIECFFKIVILYFITTISLEKGLNLA